MSNDFNGTTIGPAPSDVVLGQWCRFSRYVLLDGRIRPAADATPEWYDPWERYWLSRKPAGPTPPYQSLIGLVESLSAAIRPEDENRLLEWCQEHGVLGVMRHAGLSVLPAGGPNLPPYFSPWHGGDPDTDDYWRRYGEPLREFVAVATYFRDTFLGPDLAGLNALVSKISPKLIRAGDRGFRQVWDSESLLSSLAMMGLLDLTKGHTPRRCDTCEGLFLASRPKAIYCSSTCRDTAQKRRYRAKKRGETHG